MTIDSTEVLSIPDCQAISNLFAELGNQRTELETFVEELFNQIQELGNDVVEKSHELESQQKLLISQVDNTEASNAVIEDQELHLRQVLHELEEIKTELAEERAKNNSGTNNSQSASDDLLRQLNLAREELSIARSQLHQQSRQLENFESLKGNEHALRMQQLEQERAALESELELVRRRASEMNNSLNEHKQEAMLQKEELTSELNQLREIVETQAKDPTPPSGSPSSEVQKSEEIPLSPNELVVGSVMAQFAKVQEDTARRRAKQKK